MPAPGTAAQDEPPGRQTGQTGKQADQASAGQFRIDQRRTAKGEPGPAKSSADHLAEAGVADDPLFKIIGQAELGSPTSPVELGAVFIGLLQKAATVYFCGREGVEIGTAYRKNLLPKPFSDPPPPGIRPGVHSGARVVTNRTGRSSVI